MKPSISAVKKTVIELSVNPPDQVELMSLYHKVYQAIDLTPSCSPDMLTIDSSFTLVSISYVDEAKWEALQSTFRHEFGDNLINNKDLNSEQNDESECLNNVDKSLTLVVDDILNVVNKSDDNDNANVTNNLFDEFFSPNTSDNILTSPSLVNTSLNAFFNTSATNMDEEISEPFYHEKSNKAIDYDEDSLSNELDEGNESVSSSFSNTNEDVSPYYDGDDDKSNPSSISYDGSDLTNNINSANLFSPIEQQHHDAYCGFVNSDHIQASNPEAPHIAVNINNQNELFSPLKTRFPTLLNDFTFISEYSRSNLYSYYRLKSECSVKNQQHYRDAWKRMHSGNQINFLHIEVSQLKTFIEQLYGFEAFQDPETLPRLNHFHQFSTSSYCISFTSIENLSSAYAYMHTINHVHKLGISSTTNKKPDGNLLQLIVSEENLHRFYRVYDFTKDKLQFYIDKDKSEQSKSRLNKESFPQSSASLFATFPFLQNLPVKRIINAEDFSNKRAKK